MNQKPNFRFPRMCTPYEEEPGKIPGQAWMVLQFIIEQFLRDVITQFH